MQDVYVGIRTAVRSANVVRVERFALEDVSISGFLSSFWSNSSELLARVSVRPGFDSTGSLEATQLSYFAGSTMTTSGTRFPAGIGSDVGMVIASAAQTAALCEKCKGICTNSPAARVLDGTSLAQVTGDGGRGHTRKSSPKISSSY